MSCIPRYEAVLAAFPHQKLSDIYGAEHFLRFLVSLPHFIRVTSSKANTSTAKPVQFSRPDVVDGVPDLGSGGATASSDAGRLALHIGYRINELFTFLDDDAIYTEMFGTPAAAEAAFVPAAEAVRLPGGSPAPNPIAKRRKRPGIPGGAGAGG